MKRILLGTFYTLQGIGNLTFGLLALISDYIFGFLIGAPLALASCLSFFTALLLFLRREDWALAWGTLSSVLFIFFYGLMARNVYDNIVRGYHPRHYAILWLMVSLIIVVLNVVAIFFLYSLAKDKRKLPKLSLFF